MANPDHVDTDGDEPHNINLDTLITEVIGIRVDTLSDTQYHDLVGQLAMIGARTLIGQNLTLH